MNLRHGNLSLPSQTVISIRTGSLTHLPILFELYLLIRTLKRRLLSSIQAIREDFNFTSEALALSTTRTHCRNVDTRSQSRRHSL